MPGAAREAVDRARSGGGPSLVEAKTYRWGVHSQRAAVTPERRPADQLEAWRARDPISAFTNFATANGSIDEAGVKAVRGDVERTLDDAVAFGEASPLPLPEEALDDLLGYTGWRAASAMTAVPIDPRLRA